MVDVTKRYAQLQNRQVHVWCAFVDEIRDAGVLRAGFALLNETERTQQQRFHFEKDRHRYLVTRALVRSTLSTYVDVAPADWRFGANAHGRPHIEHASEGVRSLAFNVSHTGSLVVLAVAHELTLGIDTERIDRSVSLDVADRFFAPQEVKDLHALPVPRQKQRFFEYWTLKESYIKARGMGLAIPLDQFAFDLERDAAIGFSTRPALNDDADAWRFWQFRLQDEHLVATCARREHVTPEWVFRKTVPLVGDEALDAQLLRASR